MPVGSGLLRNHSIKPTSESGLFRYIKHPCQIKDATVLLQVDDNGSFIWFLLQIVQFCHVRAPGAKRWRGKHIHFIFYVEKIEEIILCLVLTSPNFLL
ncbi:hypothetical protein PC116_g16189 [Phytophthora cactorum]|uniref:Uncharacterized protein n=1 Tax=Phytophthora cactorum TaxID=29920 RepID=A0A8T1KG84_9STRA|nr:hypothetical protein PC112_g4934 [Phytophthora cactorum]KAG2839031.1 hypothetical protein PC111_g4005 [Phytophthora cactorum]KAG2900842.1 hypothetical protein PC114_g13430 [Phytophthora cactorum]KAG2914109.1 hypothetical protein PC115_g11786 [Phytophthora cactorum]KAG2978166.1 hypothetical protein PC118_g12444 [Phytophthora cactorum]